MALCEGPLLVRLLFGHELVWVLKQDVRCLWRILMQEQLFSSYQTVFGVVVLEVQIIFGVSTWTRTLFKNIFVWRFMECNEGHKHLRKSVEIFLPKYFLQLTSNKLNRNNYSYRLKNSSWKPLPPENDTCYLAIEFLIPWNCNNVQANQRTQRVQ